MFLILKKTLLINPKNKKNEKKQHTLGLEKKRMLDLGFEGEREKKRKKENIHALILHYLPSLRINTWMFNDIF